MWRSTNTKPALKSSFFGTKSPFTLIPSRNYGSATDSDQSHILRLIHLLNTSRSPKLTRQSHARSLVLGLSENPFLATKLISSYADQTSLADSRRVFDSPKLKKNVFLYNTLIGGFVKGREYYKAFEIFVNMCRNVDDDDVSPDCFTAATLAKASGEIGHVAIGESVHGKILRSGLVYDVVVSNSLVNMYVKLKGVKEARKVFDEMPLRNSSSWNALLAGYASRLDRNGEVWEIVRSMKRIDNVDPDGFTISIILPLCVDFDGGDRYGREIHCYVMRRETGNRYDARFGCCFIDMYSKSKRIKEARRVFDRTENRNVFVWTAIVNGYANNDDSIEALSLFRDMRSKDRIEPNHVSLLAILRCVGGVGGLIACKQVHGYAIHNHIEHENDDKVSFSNALIDAYAKNGSLDLARRVFNDMIVKDTISFSTMIGAYGSHSRGEEALSLYRETVRTGTKPNAISIVAVLSACARTGLVKEGLEIYDSAIRHYKIEPTAEIFGCVVDMLGRAGELDKALEFIEKMPMKPGASIWGSVLNASVIHGELETRQLAYQALAGLEPDSPANLVSLSNSYASSERWARVGRVRAVMRERGLRKEPGCSWVTVNSATHLFFVADKSHPCSDSVYQTLACLVLAMREQGKMMMI